MCKFSRNVSNKVLVKNDTDNDNNQDESYYCDNITKANVNIVT